MIWVAEKIFHAFPNIIFVTFPLPCFQQQQAIRSTDFLCRESGRFRFDVQSSKHEIFNRQLICLIKIQNDI